MGNYTSFGNTKFIPELEIDKFEEILKCSEKYNEISYYWECIKGVVYDNSASYKTINLTENNGKNSYYLGGIKQEDIKHVDEFLAGKDIETLNTRLMMISPNKFAYLVASIDERIEEWEESNIIGYYGKYKYNCFYIYLFNNR
jgi:dipeptidyl-peptidase-3